MSNPATQNPDEIREVAKQYLGEFIPAKRLATINASTPLVTGGILDSITLVELAASLEDHYGIKFQNHEMSVDYFDSLADIASVVQAKIAESQ
jgi:acyl carrier protein